MKKKSSLLVLFLFAVSALFSDSEILQIYKQNFLKADIAAKTEILKNVMVSNNTNEVTKGLYEYALDFVLQNSELLNTDIEMIHLVKAVVQGLEQIRHTESVNALWRLFNNFPDSGTRAETLVAIGKLGKKNKVIINNVNEFLLQQNSIYTGGSNVDYALISACIAAILELGDSSSYYALFNVLCSGYPEIISYEALGALELIPGDYIQFIFNVIEKQPNEYKFTAFKTGIGSTRLTVSQRGQLAELALNQSLFSQSENPDLSAMRYSAVVVLTHLRWTRANALAIRHYYLVQMDYQQNLVQKERFLEAIALLGAVGNSDAALVLVLQLGLINAGCEKSGDYDSEITLAIVRALGSIGDKAAFDHLLYIDQLSYNRDIKAAAKEAIDLLKW